MGLEHSNPRVERAKKKGNSEELSRLGKLGAEKTNEIRKKKAEEERYWDEAFEKPAIHDGGVPEATDERQN